MRDEQWQIIKDCALGKHTGKIPAAMIVDSPWIPGYLGLNTIDFCMDVNLCIEAYDKLKAEYPDLIFIPDYWLEFGMAAEPSGFGCKVNFYDHQPIMISHIITDCEDVEQLLAIPDPDPKKDGLMGAAVRNYARVKDSLHARGEKIRMVASRGPLNIATHLMSVSEFCLLLKLDPDNAHKLIKKTTKLVKRWLHAQIDALDYVEGILVLDDLIGFLSEDDFMEFAYPYFKEIYDEFDLPVKALHNDKADNTNSYPYIKDWGVNIFNFTDREPIDKVRELCGDSVCLMGNVPPLLVLTEKDAEASYNATIDVLKKYGKREGLLLSPGGGASPGMPAENLHAMLKALDDYNKMA